MDSQPSASRVYASDYLPLNQVNPYSSSSECSVTDRTESVVSGKEIKYNVNVKTCDEVQSTLDESQMRFGLRNKSKFVTPKAHTTSNLTSYYHTVRSQVPQSLVMDANRRQIASKLLQENSISKGLLNS